MNLKLLRLIRPRIRRKIIDIIIYIYIIDNNIDRQIVMLRVMHQVCM